MSGLTYDNFSENLHLEILKSKGKYMNVVNVASALLEHEAGVEHEAVGVCFNFSCCAGQRQGRVKVLLFSR